MTTSSIIPWLASAMVMWTVLSAQTPNAEQNKVSTPPPKAGNGSTPAPPVPDNKLLPDPEDDEQVGEVADAEAPAVALPVSPEPVRVYGWREDVIIDGIKDKLLAKLDTGALTSSIHAEEQELFERDGKKWVRFIVVDTRRENQRRYKLEAPLVRVAHIKEPNGPSQRREVVRLSFQIGERKLRGEFSLNNRNNMLAPVLLGRNTMKDLGWVDPARTHLADQKVLR